MRVIIVRQIVVGNAYCFCCWPLMVSSVASLRILRLGYDNEQPEELSIHQAPKIQISNCITDASRMQLGHDSKSNSLSRRLSLCNGEMLLLRNCQVSCLPAWWRGTTSLPRDPVRASGRQPARCHCKQLSLGCWAIREASKSRGVRPHVAT